MLNFTRRLFLGLLLASLLPFSPAARAQTGPGWARAIGGGRVVTGGTDYVYTIDNVSIIAFTSQGRQRWARPMTGSSIGAMAADAAGNLWVAGSSTNGFSVGGQPVSSGGYIVKLGPQGNVVWARAIGLAQGLNPVSIGLGSNGEVFIVSLSGTYPGGPGVDGFVLGYDAAGTLRWMQSAPGATVQALAVDASNNVWLAGSFHTTASFGGTPLTRAGRNGFLARYSAQGQLQWAKIFAAPGKHVPYVSSTIPTVSGLRAHGNAVYLTCGVNDTVDFETTRVVAPNFSSQGVLVRYDAQGNQQWLRQLVGNAIVVGGLGLDASGNAVVGGSFLGSLSANQLSTSSLSVLSDLFVVQYSPQGVAQWLRHERLAANQFMTDVTADAAGNVYATGVSTGSSGTIVLGDTTLPAGTLFLVRFGGAALASKAPAELGSLQLYPNPGQAGQPAQLTWATPAAPGTTLTVLNALGQVVRTQPVALGSRAASVATSGLMRGCYLLQLRTAAGLSACRLVVE